MTTFNTIVKQILSESPDYETYHETLWNVTDEISKYVKKKGYAFRDDPFLTISTGGVSYGNTKKGTDEVYLVKNGKSKGRYVFYSVYRMDSGRYELTMYIDGYWKQ